MSVLSDVELTIHKFLQSVPDLPKDSQKLLAENAWLFTLIGVFLAALSVPFYINLLQLALEVSPGFSGYFVSTGYGNPWTFAAVVSVFFTVVASIIAATAISPLKQLERRGWEILFIVLVVNAVEVVFKSFIDFDLFGFFFAILVGLLGLGISAYFLFQIRPYFKSVKIVKSTIKK